MTMTKQVLQVPTHWLHSLKPYVAEVRVVTGFHEVCKEHGEDLTDFFVKYGKTKQDLTKYILETPAFTAEQRKFS